MHYTDDLWLLTAYPHVMLSDEHVTVLHGTLVILNTIAPIRLMVTRETRTVHGCTVYLPLSTPRRMRRSLIAAFKRLYPEHKNIVNTIT